MKIPPPPQRPPGAAEGVGDPGTSRFLPLSLFVCYTLIAIIMDDFNLQKIVYTAKPLNTPIQ
jgi:hypothetical protein